MAGVLWPSPPLPATFAIDGFARQAGNNVIVEEMEVGPPKTRRRASVSTVRVTAQMKLTTDQLQFFYGFLSSTLFDGTRPFQMRDDFGVLRDYYVEQASDMQDMSTWPLWVLTLQMRYVA